MTEIPTDNAPSDWVLAPNIHRHPELYALENEALARDGRLDEALSSCAPWSGKTLLDLGCGTGFWLPRYAQQAARVIGVEPDPTLVARMQAQRATWSSIEVLSGSAEHIPLPDAHVDVVHARFAYFFGEGAEKGLQEVGRVLRPGGVFAAVDNSWEGGEFATLLRWSTQGNGTIDPDRARRWWHEQGARRVDVEGAWVCESPEQLEAILRIEFSPDVVDRFVQSRPPAPSISYHFALYVIKRESILS